MTDPSVMPLSWDFELFDNTATKVGPLSAYDKRVAVGLGAIGQFGFRVRLENRYADNLLSADKMFVKGYQHEGGVRQLRYIGPITSAQEYGDETGSFIACVSQEPTWRLTKRRLGKTFLGWAPTHTYKRENMYDYLQYANGNAAFASVGASAQHTGVDIGSQSGTSAPAIDPVFYKQAWDALRELSMTANGPDMRFRPREPVFETGNWNEGPASQMKLGYLDFIENMGQTRDDIVFDNFDKKNVKSYSRNVDAGAVANRVFSVGTEGDATVTPLIANDSTSQTDRGLYEDTLDTDLVSDSMRSDLIAAHVLVRKTPRTQWSFTPTANVASSYVFFRDYDLGDVVPLRIKKNGVMRINGLLRIYGAVFDIDPQGIATPNLIVMP